MHKKLLADVLSRNQSFLQADIEANRSLLSVISTSRVLVIGAAGSIGGAFVNSLIEYHPKQLHLVDISENNLVEVVRDLRSSGRSVPEDFKTFTVDFGQPEFNELLQYYDYDYVLNFSALKHVRSERDPFTLMRLLQTNVIANSVLVDQLVASKTKRLFSVSSDKAVRPGNLMGASKAFMERVLLSRADEIPFSSARFANVAFSDGSLLHSFRQRLEKRQPLSSPNDVKRYFISHEEAGQLCLLGCFLGNNREIVYPRFEPQSDMMTFSEIAKCFLQSNGLTPVECGSEAEALEMASQLGENSTDWPCYFSASNTSGEKAFEEFVDPAESTDEQRFENVGVVTNPLEQQPEILRQAMDMIQTAGQRGKWTVEELKQAVMLAVPELNHVIADKNLDQKM